MSSNTNSGYSTIQLLDVGGDDDESSDDELILPSSKGDDTPANLQFQEFPMIASNSPLLTKSDIHDSEDSDEDDDDQKELLKDSKKASSFWTFEYYKGFFDIDTNDVISRIFYSMIPSRQNYLLTKIRPNPDLYGPFWVCSTLVFIIAICGNLSSFFAGAGDPTKSFKSDFQLVSLSAAVIFSYSWLVPALIWGFLLWRGNQPGFSFLEIVCVYGYSLAIFIPISIIWIAPFDWLRWLLVFIGVFASGSVLAATFWTPLADESTKTGVLSVLVILTLHAALAVGFKLYFFNSIKIHDGPAHYVRSVNVTTTAHG